MDSVVTTATRPDTIVLVHGLWMSPLSWEHWVDRYTKAGYRVLAPAWPGMEGTVERLRANTEPYDRVGMAEVIDHYAEIIGKLDSPRIIMGHSFGGASAEVLIDRGSGAAGVAIDPAGVKGVLGLPVSTLRSALPVLEIRSPTP
jgi:alpha-beta hydrolase superfamily lysophospholipase